ncbi:unnamed protein product [Lactuca virosa]|uniref:NADH dehydrogenase [ubiquinone] 1 beta subcomplex subunit 9 n=1 Tax=Lactuca virosa TaxID=75947 RepID=A0AAU9LES9_9ASTR|nr:unnamed protein product [Lactuca virosa]
MSGAASYLARRAAQREKVRILYRRALKDTLNWAVHCHLFYPDADALRERFDANKNVVRFFRLLLYFTFPLFCLNLSYRISQRCFFALVLMKP